MVSMDVVVALEELVSIPSVFPNEHRIAEFVETLLKKEGFNVRRDYVSKNRFNLLAERGKGKRSILFYAHLDTVPNYGSWIADPLTLTRRGDKLYGLGSCDMKGGLAAALVAASDVYDKKVKFLLCVDEENISEGIWHAIKHKRWFRDVELAISCEPGDSRRRTGGANIVTIGRRGRVVISIDIKGLSAHGANPQRGVNAIDEASTIVKHIKMFKLQRHRRLGPETIFVRSFDSDSTSLAVPDKAHLELDIHLVPPSTVKSAVDRTNVLIRHLFSTGRLDQRTKIVVRIKERETPYIAPYVHDGRNRHVRKVLSIIRSVYKEPVLNYGSSVADDNILSNQLHMPVITLGPAGGNEHSQNEWVSYESLNNLVRLYNAIIKEM